ncbi:MAG: terminase small subunit [Pseudomonadota bacterium]
MTPKQQRFVDEYLLDLNGTQAAIRAGYSAKTAEQQAARLCRNVKVQAAITAGQLSRSERTKIDADWVLRRLGEEVDADLSDLYDDAGKLKPVKDWPSIWRKGLVAGIETIVDGDGETVHKIKLADRGRRLEMLGKHVFVSAFREQIDHTSSDGSMSPPSLADFYGAGEAKADAG